MAQKYIHIDGVGEVALQKRKGTSSIRMTVKPDGTLRVSLPAWSPYKAGEAFVRSKRAWVIEQQKGKSKHIFKPNERIGKGHRLRFVAERRQTITSRVTKTELIVRLPLGQDTTELAVQKVVYAGAMRAMKQQATHLLPMRLQTLASKHGFKYRTVAIKHLKSRWGSCSSQKDIALNSFLMQLPWELIDYVLLHELLHTQIMAHGQVFWRELGKHVSDLPRKRKTLKTYQPALVAQD